ncbi:putative histone acetyltransferase [Medicago truncatula]|nr:uncharacterized protein LOC25499443 [Medicago truncatula]RHN48746.1 putative histone acetyltransferase [Medicago truncatula]
MQRHQQPITEMQKGRITDLSKRLDEGLFKAALTKDDYMNLDTLESRLSNFLRQATMHNHNKQSPQLVSSSPMGTMIPTPGMSYGPNSSMAVAPSIDASMISSSGCNSIVPTSFNSPNMLPAGGMLGSSKVHKDVCTKVLQLSTETPKDSDMDTVSGSIYSTDQLEEFVSKLAAHSHLNSLVSTCSSSALSQNSNAQKISEIMQKLKPLVSKDLDSIMSTTGVVEEISSLVKDLNEIKDHLSFADFGTFSAVQMAIGRFENIKLALSNYHGVHQEQQEVCGCIQELIQHRTNVNGKHEELNQRKQQVSNRIIVLRHDLQEAEKELQTILADKKTNTASGKHIESKINEEYSKGVNLMTKMSSIETEYHSALSKKASLAEHWAYVQACFFPKSV